MRIPRLSIILVLTIVVVSCEESSKSVKAPITELKKPIDDVQKFEDIEQYNEENDTLKITTEIGRNLNDKKLPILPPIILLDFAGDHKNSSSASGEEKSKRTIDSNLGYGFGRNNLFTGKYNYYFPAGKTGTSVSIEESISPFLPKTIVESVKPITEKSNGDGIGSYGQNPLRKNVNNHQSALNLHQSNSQILQPNNRYQHQMVFGQRTKLYKPSQIISASYQYSSTPKNIVETTPTTIYRVESQPNNQNSYATVRPNIQINSYGNGFSHGPTSQRPYTSYSSQTSQSYVTPTAPSYQTSYPESNSYGTSHQGQYESVTTARPIGNDYHEESSLSALANLPRYTIENGVRYENKIVWKYPDGRISQTPPASYVNAYNEFLIRRKPGADVSAPNYQNLGTYQNPDRPSYQETGQSSYHSGGTTYQNGAVSGISSQTSFQNQNYQSQPIRYQQEYRYQSPETFANINSQSPAQFPKDQDNVKRPPSQFVSSASLASGNYDLGSSLSHQSYEHPYQGQYGEKTHPRGDTLSLQSSVYQNNEQQVTIKDSYGSSNYNRKLRPISKYSVNSPDPEYTYSTDSPLKSTTPTSLFTPSGELSPNILSKYSTQAQKYLTKVFANDGSTSRPTISGPESYDTSTSSYGAENYENLLNYNPSIAEYIRDPSTILNARPTFVQAGNSLIPVIILRVDGAPPLRPKTTPNINLKALLQQYLTQYASSLGQNANYEIGNQGSKISAPPSQQNPVYELAQLAQSLTQYSEDPTIVDQYSKQLDSFNHSPYETTNSYSTRTSYDDRPKNSQHSTENHGGKIGKQKVKSVQIIEDPRFTSYKVNS